MSAVCPEGHTSESTDYCDVCGEPIAAAETSSPVRSSAVEPNAESTTSATVDCPNCGTPAEDGALFCENCGYDFTTGTAPTPLEPPEGVEVSAPAVAAPEAPHPVAAPDPDPESDHEPDAGAGSQAEWVAEIWIDPDWAAAQEPEDPMPSVGAPVVVPLRGTTFLVGRPSKSRGISPDIDCAGDSGVSRRHCQLATDGTRWWVEDLQSANGTYVNAIGDPLPADPITPGERVELADGVRIFIGGWTRIVVRQA